MRTTVLIGATAAVALLASCDKKSEPAPEDATPTFWQELELTASELDAYCDEQREDHRENPRDARDLELLPARSVKTPEWSGFIRFIPERKSTKEACFALVNVPEADANLTAVTFRQKLGLPDCTYKITSPTGVGCFVADDDPTGLAMWQARFNEDGELLVLGLATKGYAPGRTETMSTANWWRPKARPTIAAGLQGLDSMTPRFEVDDFGITFATTGPSFLTEVELEPTLERFEVPVEDCNGSASRCTIPNDAEPPEREEQLRTRLNRYERTRKLLAQKESERLHQSVAIDAAADRPWRDVRKVVSRAQAHFDELLLVGDRPTDGVLPRYGVLPLSESLPNAGQVAEEVAEPEGAAPVARTARLTPTGLMVQIGPEVRTFARTDSGYDWRGAHQMLAELAPKTLTRPKLLVTIEPDVLWSDVVKLAEIAAFRRTSSVGSNDCDLSEATDASFPCIAGPLYAVKFSD